MKGLIHIYTGNGKGKTTAAVGLGIRACGRGLKVVMVQFLKGAETGEMLSIKKLEPGFVLHRGTELKKFTWQMTKDEYSTSKKQQEDMWSFAVDTASGGECDLLILDEIMGAISVGMIDENAVAELMKTKPEALELVLTGRDASDRLIELADYVSRIEAVKHPMEKGIPARKGIEC